MSKSILILGGITVLLVAGLSIALTLVGIRKKAKKKLEDGLNKLETEKNSILSATIITELKKVESLVNNKLLQDKYNKWVNEFNYIKDQELSRLTDLLLDIETLIETKEYKEAFYKSSNAELEIDYVKTSMENLVDEIREITMSEERNREAITKLKTIYREIVIKFNDNKNDYKDVINPIELQFENINKLFSAFERTMENNEYEEVGKIVKALDDLVKNIKIVIDESPTILFMGKILIPKKISDVTRIYTKMIKDGYNLEYLKLEYNTAEANKKLNDIFDRLNVLNLEDSIFELKTLLDYFESLFFDFDKEKSSKKLYEQNLSNLRDKIGRLSMVIKNIYAEIEELKVTYDLTEEEVLAIDGVNSELLDAKGTYKIVNDRSRIKTNPFSKLNKECDLLSVSLYKIEDKLDETLKSLSSLKEDELRAREQLADIREILRNAKHKIREFSLPVVPKQYYVELEESVEGIKEIYKELDNKPISIKTLNTRVDTGRDLVLKVYSTSKDLAKSASMAEMAIVYGNRYRSISKEVEASIIKAEKEFWKGEYRHSLETILNGLNLVEPGIHKKLMSAYEE